MENQTGHIDQIKQLNTGIVYRIIDQHGPISRIALSKQAQLAPASITKITRELIDAHLVKEIEFPVLGLRGRPAIGLVVESEGWQFLSIRIEKPFVCFSLKEINTQTIVEHNYPFTVCGNTQFTELLASLISQFFSCYSYYLERVTAISIIVDGIIEPYTGVILKLPHFDIHNLSLGEFLREQTGLPIYIQPYVNALALTDHFSLHAKRTAKNIIYLQIDDIVSAAIINNGISLDSTTHRAVHFGHLQTLKNGSLCYCGAQGCLETQLSMNAVLQQIRGLLPFNPSSKLFNQPMTIESFCFGIETQDPLCLSVLNNIAQLLAEQLALMINIFGTELILINSPLNKVSSIFYPLLHQFSVGKVIPLYSNNLHIEKSELLKTNSETALIQQALYDGSLLLQLLQG